MSSFHPFIHFIDITYSLTISPLLLKSISFFPYLHCLFSLIENVYSSFICKFQFFFFS